MWSNGGVGESGARLFSFTVRQWRQIPRVLAISALLGALVGLGLRESSVPLVRPLLIGALAGLLVATLLMVLRQVVWNSRLVLLRFGWFTLVNLVLNAAVIVVALQLASLPFGGFEEGVAVRVFVGAAVIAAGITGWFTVDRLLGAGVLFGLLTGRYHQPRREERVFLFADVADSTTIAQELGDLRYHSFLNRLFTEMGPDVERYGGTVHRYVGDEIVITWTAPAGIADAACLRCALAILDTVRDSDTRFRDLFGVAPRLRVALHAGQVVAGEISGLKREIVFSGDTVNTAARIEGVASEIDQDLVISDDLLRQLEVPNEIEIQPLGSFRLKGRAATTDLFAASRSPVGS